MTPGKFRGFCAHRLRVGSITWLRHPSQLSREKPEASNLSLFKLAVTAFWLFTSPLITRVLEWTPYPASTRHWTNAVSMLAHRLRRRPSIKTTLDQRLVWAGYFHPRDPLSRPGAAGVTITSVTGSGVKRNYPLSLVKLRSLRALWHERGGKQFMTTSKNCSLIERGRPPLTPRPRSGAPADGPAKPKGGICSLAKWADTAFWLCTPAAEQGALLFIRSQLSLISFVCCVTARQHITATVGHGSILANR